MLSSIYSKFARDEWASTTLTQTSPGARLRGMTRVSAFH